MGWKKLTFTNSREGVGEGVWNKQECVIYYSHLPGITFIRDVRVISLCIWFVVAIGFVFENKLILRRVMSLHKNWDVPSKLSVLRSQEIAMRDFRLFENRDPVTRDRNVLFLKRWFPKKDKTPHLIMRSLIREPSHETDQNSELY